MNPLNLIIRPASVYRFAELLQMPFNQYEAYNAKIINDKGKVISEQGSMDGLEYIAIRLRSMFKELMPGSTQYFLRSLSGTLKLFNEEFSQMGLTVNDVNVAVELHLLSESQGKISYLDYLLEEATQRYITEEMTSGAVGNVGTVATPDKQGGLAGIDLPLGTMQRRTKKKKNLKDIMVEANAMVAQQPPPVIGLRVDVTDVDDLRRATTASGTFDPSQLSKPGSKKYWKKFIERSKPGSRIFVDSEGQDAPFELRLPVKPQSERKT